MIFQNKLSLCTERIGGGSQTSWKLRNTWQLYSWQAHRTIWCRLRDKRVVSASHPSLTPLPVDDKNDRPGQPHRVRPDQHYSPPISHVDFSFHVMAVLFALAH